MSTTVKRHNIFLAGMMGSGKSTIGRMLAGRLDYSFVDTDERIESICSLKVAEIFTVMRETHFRELETSLLNTVVRRENQVIATGGGMLVNHLNMQTANENGMVVYLSAPIPVLVERLRHAKDRPLLSGFDLYPRLEDIYKTRRETYESILRKVETDGVTFDTIVDSIIALYEKWQEE